MVDPERVAVARRARPVVGVAGPVRGVEIEPGHAEHVPPAGEQLVGRFDRARTPADSVTASRTHGSSVAVKRNGCGSDTGGAACPG